MKFLTTSLLCLISVFSFGQTDPNNVPKPPADRLKIYEPFFGKYTMTSEYSGLKFNGTLEIKPVIKNWYVEQTIIVTTPDNKIDREFRMMVTYDTIQQKYRVWRFETMPPIPEESKLRTEGNDIILEMQLPPAKADEKPIIFFNRYSMVSKDELKIISEAHALDGSVIEKIGTSTAYRIK